MNSSFINPTITRASELGVGLYEDSHPLELFSHDSSAEIEIIIHATYRQVLGNAHIMESDRLTTAESQLNNGNITVRDFVRNLGRSELYRALFFNNYTSLRAIEVNFKHFLGRAPHSYEEIVEHSHILQSAGYDAEIDSYLDGEEYLTNFGENIVPYYQGYKTQTGKNVVGFTHLFNLLRGSCSSDRSTCSSNRPRLQKALINKHPSSIIPLATVSANWQGNDTNQLRGKTLNLPSHQSFSSPTQPPSKSTAITSRSTIWQNQYNVLANANPIELISGSSDTELEIVINAAYKQVLGNAHIMESERLTVAESQLKRGEISVREFVRWLAKSELYKSRFIDNCPRYRSHELNFKHLLGRAPDEYQETFSHSQTLDHQGYEADIDSYLDSDEYQAVFGENIVPYYRGYKTQTGKTLLGYTNMFQMLESVSTSDKAGASGNSPRLVKSLIHNNPNGNVPVTDIQALLQNLFRGKTQATAPQFPSDIPEVPQSESQTLEAEIVELETQLAELRSLATIGAAGISKWQSDYTDINNNVPTSGSSQTQQERIETLKQEIAQARSLASIGEARLNKWRSRLFF